MLSIRNTFASLAAACLIALPAAADDALCQEVDALVLSGQQKVSWEDLFKPRPNELRNDNIYPTEPLLGLFRKCTIIDTVDNVGRPSTTLSCTLTEAEAPNVVTQESRAAFMANEFTRFHAISECLSAKENWSSYGHVGQGNFNAFLKKEGETKIEDAISAQMTVMQFGGPPLYNASLTFNLVTAPRDYR